ILTIFLVRAVAQQTEAIPKLMFKVPAGKVELFEMVELPIEGVPKVDNTFDPESISVDLKVTSSLGKAQHVPGFIYREFERKLENGRETLSPKGEADWRVRWLPVEVGKHDLSITAWVKGKTLRAEGSVEVAAGKRQGLVRVEPKAKRYFYLDDGTPLFLK